MATTSRLVANSSSGGLMSNEPLFKVGDVITVKGTGVPKELEDKFFRVESDEMPIRLSRPYEDQACTRPYHPIDPRTRRDA
jgi:hypothetical protein